MLQTTQRDLLASLTNADETSHPSGKIVEREQITGTPFWIIGNDQKTYFLVMGRHKLSPALHSHQEVLEYINKHEWLIQFNMIVAIITDMKNFDQEEADKVVNAIQTDLLNNNNEQ